jgi:Flp pilus assembly protein TadG
MSVDQTVSLKRRNDRRRGHAMLEGALILTIFLSFLIGTLDFAQFLYFHQSLVERVRTAARYGAVHPTDTTAIRNMAVYNKAVLTGSETSLVPNLTTDLVSVSSLSAGTSEARVTVTISNYPFQFFSPFIARAGTARSITATMISEAP